MNIRTIPKVELHCHLEACFRPATVMEVGRTLGLDIPQDPDVFHPDWLLTRPLANLEVALARGRGAGAGCGTAGSRGGGNSGS